MVAKKSCCQNIEYNKISEYQNIRITSRPPSRIGIPHVCNLFKKRLQYRCFPVNFTFLTEHLGTTSPEFRRRTQIPEFYHYLKKQRFPFATICVESLHFWKQQAFSPVVHLQQAFRKTPSQIFSVKMLAWGWRAEKYFLLFICISMKLFPVALVSFSDLGSLHFPFRPSFLLLS